MTLDSCVSCSSHKCFVWVSDLEVMLPIIIHVDVSVCCCPGRRCLIHRIPTQYTSNKVPFSILHLYQTVLPSCHRSLVCLRLHRVRFCPHVSLLTDYSSHHFSFKTSRMRKHDVLCVNSAVCRHVDNDRVCCKRSPLWNETD